MPLISIFSNGLVTIGALILAAALFPIRKLILKYPHRNVRYKWFILFVLINIFIIGYISYIVSHWSSYNGTIELVVPVIFFLGGVFVYLVSLLSLQTTIDIQHMADLERENITDPLMKLYNRRYMERRLEEEVARSQRYHLPLAILLIDIDYLKKINDTFGHQAGDAVLNELGNLIVVTIRGSDIAARYGGDEILVIAPNTEMQAAATLAERICQAVAASKHETWEGRNAKASIPMTVSIGVTCYCKEISDAAMLVATADRALYEAKSHGRNRVMVSDQYCRAPSSQDSLLP
jgi:diguanylate cyclase (GGDEF)-like protein